jgi:hypothetical protein
VLIDMLTESFELDNTLKDSEIRHDGRAWENDAPHNLTLIISRRYLERKGTKENSATQKHHFPTA